MVRAGSFGHRRSYALLQGNAGRLCQVVLAALVAVGVAGAIAFETNVLSAVVDTCFANVALYPFLPLAVIRGASFTTIVLALQTLAHNQTTDTATTTPITTTKRQQWDIS